MADDTPTHKDEQLSEILALDAAGEYSDCGDTLRALSAALERAERERDETRAAALEKVRRERDEARARAAAAYEAAADTMSACCQSLLAAVSHAANRMEAHERKISSETYADASSAIRALTPDDAREALEKVRRDERERGAEFAVEYMLSHYERGDTGSVFTPDPVDPDEWWGKMQLLPHDPQKLKPRSRAHFFARMNRWKELVAAAIRGDDNG